MYFKLKFINETVTLDLETREKMHLLIFTKIEKCIKMRWIIVCALVVWPPFPVLFVLCAKYWTFKIGTASSSSFVAYEVGAK